MRIVKKYFMLRIFSKFCIINVTKLQDVPFKFFLFKPNFPLCTHGNLAYHEVRMMDVPRLFTMDLTDINSEFSF